MKTNNVSTYALNSAMRNITLDKQRALIIAQKEISTGRLADIGYTLGSFTSSFVTVESEISSIKQTIISNSFVTGRLQSMQVGLNSMVDSSNQFVGQLGAEINSTLDRQLLRDIGRSALGNVSNALNISIKGEYVFSGVNTDAPALVDYEGDSGVAAKAAVANAFQTHFGFASDDPAAGSISSNALKAFIDGPFADLFNDLNWQTNWSGASERGMRTKISTRELVENPSTAFSEPFRKAVSASVLIVEFSTSKLSEDALNQLATSALELTANATAGLGAEQASIGVVEERVGNANERMDFQQDILSQQLQNMTGVDQYEAATRLNDLIVSLEASYAVTARIQSLSLMNYI